MSPADSVFRVFLVRRSTISTQKINPDEVVVEAGQGRRLVYGFLAHGSTVGKDLPG